MSPYANRHPRVVRAGYLNATLSGHSDISAGTKSTHGEVDALFTMRANGQVAVACRVHIFQQGDLNITEVIDRNGTVVYRIAEPLNERSN